MLVSPARYDEWLRRARTGDADAVVHEVDRLLDDSGPPPEAHRPGSAGDAAARARAHYVTVVAHLRAGRAQEAAAAAERTFDEARRSESVGLVALALSSRAVLVAGADGLARGLDLFQHAERLLAGTPPDALADHDWVAALIDMWQAASGMGLRARAVELGRLCHGLSASASPYERYAIAQHTAEDMLWEALRAVRRPPYEPDEAMLGRALELAAEAARLAPAPLPPDARPRVWQAIHAAFVGDASAAADVLGDLLSPAAEGPAPSSLEPVLRAARLRALRRAGTHEEAGAVHAAEAGVGQDLADRPGSAEGVLTYLWERALWATPGLLDPDSDDGRLLLFHERQAREHERVVQGLLELNLANLELEVRHDALAALTRMDELTGVLNRRGLQPHLDRSAADPDGRTWALLLIDIDGFQAVNDNLGHDAADELLQTLGLALRRASRAQDVVARIGGDEFLVLADLTPEEPALAAAVGDRFLDTLRRLDESGVLRASVGVAVRTTPIDAGDWIALADGAMGDAKRAGGDRVARAATG